MWFLYCRLASLQGPFTLDHLKLLAEDSIIRSDTVVLHSAHGSALLSSVLAMPAPSEPPCSAQQLTGPSADTGCGSALFITDSPHAMAQVPEDTASYLRTLPTLSKNNCLLTDFVRCNPQVLQRPRPIWSRLGLLWQVPARLPCTPMRSLSQKVTNMLGAHVAFLLLSLCMQPVQHFDISATSTASSKVKSKFRLPGE